MKDTFTVLQSYQLASNNSRPKKSDKLQQYLYLWKLLSLSEGQGWSLYTFITLDLWNNSFLLVNSNAALPSVISVQHTVAMYSRSLLGTTLFAEAIKSYLKSPRVNL